MNNWFTIAINFQFRPQLTDVLGRKAVLDSLSPNISSGTDLSQYLG